MGTEGPGLTNTNTQLICIRMLHFFSIEQLKVQPCKLYNNKYVIALTQKRNSEIFAFIAALVFKLLSREVLFINRKRQ